MRAYFFLLVFIIASCTQQQEIAQWRGENRNGIFNETGLLKSWPENGPQLIWDNENMGDGYGSVAVTGEKIFVNGVIDSVSYLMALDLNGNLIWKSKNGEGYVGEDFSSSFPGSRSTPTVIGDLVYSCSGLGRIACYETNTGTEKWAVSMQKDLNGIIEFFGYGESLLIDEDKLFCYPGGKETNVAALNRFTGETIWTSKALSDTVTHCSPILIEMPSRKIFVTFSMFNLMGFDANTGDLLWSHKQTQRKYTEQSNTPIYHNGFLYYVAGDGNGAVKLELLEDGKSIKEVWRNYFGRNSMNGFLVMDNKLFSTMDKGKLFALDIDSGEISDSLKIKNGCIISADDKIYCYSDKGDMRLVDIKSQSMNVVSQFKIKKGTKHHFAHPVIHKGILYVRHGNTLLAYNIKAE